MKPAGLALVLITVALTACSQPALGPARFANREPVWRVDDRRDVPKKPADRVFPHKLYFFDVYLYDRVRQPLLLPLQRHALDVNAWDEVPDSSWFTNRIGVRDVTVEEMRKGPNRHDGPDPTSRWKVKSSKVGGGSSGFVIEDARGHRYIVKFDEPHAPVTESATDVAVQRLLWAMGYNVPENGIVYFKREDLVLDDGATVRDVFGNKRKMTWEDIDKQLHGSYRRPDGSYRALVSRFLDGVPLGGFAKLGRRSDDPNDTVPHEHRRSVRALFLLFGWVQQTDAKEDNTLDVWVEEGGTHYVRHFLVDFGKSFGTSAFVARLQTDGHAENIDYGFMGRSLVSLGLWKRPYEGTPTPGFVGVGAFDAAHYEPANWRPHAHYAPFRYVDHRDILWAGKLLSRFTPELIRAAVEQGRYEDPRAVDYLVEVLVARQKKAVRYAFTQTAALDRFVVRAQGSGWEVCFDDLLAISGLQPGARAATWYRATSYDYDGRPLAATTEAREGTDRTACATGIVAGPSSSDPDRDGYVIVRIDTERADLIQGRRRLPAVEVHLARTPGGPDLRVVGIHRQ